MTTEVQLHALMIASLNGDAGSYNIFLRDVSARLRSFFRRKLSSFGRGDTEAEDLVQETLIAIHSRRHTFDTKMPIMPWIFAIARYKLIDHLRASKIRIELSLDAAESLAAKDEQESIESRMDLNTILGSLPEAMQDAVRMIKLDGLSVAEASQKSGRSESSIKVSVHRGLKAISKALSMRGLNENK